MNLCACGCGAEVQGTWKRGHKRREGPEWAEEDWGYDTLCWIWRKGASDGYGRYSAPGSKHAVLAHRAVYERLVGPVPAGKVLDHLCNVPLCVNPQHLEPVTQGENVRRAHHRQRRDWRLVLDTLAASPIEEHQILASRLAARAAMSPRNVARLRAGR